MRRYEVIFAHPRYGEDWATSNAGTFEREAEAAHVAYLLNEQRRSARLAGRYIVHDRTLRD